MYRLKMEEPHSGSSSSQIVVCLLQFSDMKAPGRQGPERGLAHGARSGSTCKRVAQERVSRHSVDMSTTRICALDVLIPKTESGTLWPGIRECLMHN